MDGGFPGLKRGAGKKKYQDKEVHPYPWGEKEDGDEADDDRAKEGENELMA